MPWWSRASPSSRADRWRTCPGGDFWPRAPTTPLRGASGPPAAWLTLAAMTINMGRAIATLAGHGLGEATLATLQGTMLAVPARLAHSAQAADGDGRGTAGRAGLPDRVGPGPR